MSSVVTQITPNNQKETQPGVEGRVETFDGGSIEVVYPPGWNTPIQTATIPSNLIHLPVPQTPEERLLEQSKALIRSAANAQDLSTAIRRMKEAIYIIPPTEINLEKSVLPKAA